MAMTLRLVTEEPFLDEEGVELYKDAKHHADKGNHIEALVILEDLLSVHGEDKYAWTLLNEQGEVFLKLAKKTDGTDMGIAYLLGCVECFRECGVLSPICASSLQKLALNLGSVLYYKKCLKKAREGLLFNLPGAGFSLEQQNFICATKENMQKIIKDAEFKISESKTSSLQNCELKFWEPKKSQEPLEDRFNELRSYWVGLDVKVKRDFMKVSIAKLTSFVEGLYFREGRNVLEQVLASAKRDRKWTFWMCRTLCSMKISKAEDCMSHLEQHHAADFEPSSEKDIVKRIGKDWTLKISKGSWEPVDTAAAVEMINNQLADVKAFASTYKNGWSKEWPTAEDEERSNLLEEIKLLLVSLCGHKILSRSIRDWLMLFPVKHLGKLEVSEQSLIDCRLMETPQSICFLECLDLNQILDFLRKIKCERDDGTDLVCRAVDSLLDHTRVKEKIDFDPQFSYLLLDRRLLKVFDAPFDDEGKINVFDPNVHYAKAPAQGDDILSWLTDYNSVDKPFPRPIREHYLDIWIAVLRVIQFTCRTLGAKYAKKAKVLHYDAALTVIENLCISEDERRRDLQEDQWNRYASLICNRCEERVTGISLATKLFLCAVRDVLNGELLPSLDPPSIEDCMHLIRDHKSLSDDIVLKSIHLLKSVVTHKVLLVDSKILLIDNSRISLLNKLTRLSVFDNRTYILQVLKPFLLNEIVNMNSKAKSAAAEADLLFEEEKKSQPKKKKNKSKKKTSSSKSCPLDTTVEHEPPVNLESGSTSSAQKKVEEDSMEPEAAFANERGRLEISSNTEHQEEVTEDDSGMQNMPGEDPLGEAAARYNSALDMTLKALLKIKVLKDDLVLNKQPFHGQLGEQVPSSLGEQVPSLQNLFTAFVSEVIKTEGVYSCLFRDFLASLEQVLPMSNDAAEVLVAVLEFWHCWKNSEKESLVTRLFTLEETERMSCRKCRRITNYPEQSSYGIVMAAHSIRELKFAFGNIKFVDVLKVIRREHKMLCCIKTGGCGKTHFVDHTISRCPPIFTIVLEWEKSETDKEISETTKALEWEIDISRLYKDLEPNTIYQLVSMVGCGEEKECICIAYENNRWVNLRRESLAGEDVGNWNSVVSFCGERKVRPEILFYEAVRSMA